MFVRVVVYPAFLFPVPAMDVGVCVCGVRACVLVVFSFLFFNLFGCLFACSLFAFCCFVVPFCSSQTKHLNLKIPMGCAVHNAAPTDISDQINDFLKITQA